MHHNYRRASAVINIMHLLTVDLHVVLLERPVLAHVFFTLPKPLSVSRL